MPVSRSICLLLVGWFVTISAGPVCGGDSLAEKLPAGAVASAELVNAEALLDRIRGSEVLQSVVESEAYEKWSDSVPGRRFRGGRAVIEGQIGLNLWEAAARLFGDQMIVALYPPSGRKQPDGIALIHLADDEAGSLIREKAQPWIDLADGQVLTEDREGTWLLETKDGKAFGALQGRWLVLASQKHLRTDTLGLLNGTASGSLAESAAWKSQTPGDGPQTTRLSVVYDADALRAATGKDRLLPAKIDNPPISLLLGGLLELTAVSPSIRGELTVNDVGFQLSLRTPQGRDAVAPAYQTLLTTAETADALTPQVPRRLGGVTLCRDWKEWYRQREQLIEARVLPEFDKFETGLSTFLPGKDFAEDVLGLLNAPMSFVAAEQTYPHLDGKPGLQLPAFGVVLDLRDPQRGADVFQLFFQTLGTVINLEAGKQGRQPWVLHSEAHNDVQVTYAKYLDRPQGEDLPLVFNFQPAAGLVGDKYVAATSLELCRDLIDTVKVPVADRATDAGAPRNFEFHLEPTVAATLLEANRAVITAKSVQDGKTLQQATGELDALLLLLRRMTPLSITTDVSADQATFTIQGGWQ